MDNPSPWTGIAVTALWAKEAIEKKQVNHYKDKVDNQIIPAVCKKPVNRQ